MKIVVLLSCVVLLMARSAHAQAQGIYNGAMGQARRAVANTEAASNQNPDGQPPGQGAQSAQPMDPALAATLKNIASLNADLKNLNLTSPPAPALTNDLMQAATGTKPSLDQVAKLAADLQTAVAGKPAIRAHYQKMAQFLHATVNGSHLKPAQFQMISDGIEKILDDGGSSYDDKKALLRDLKDSYHATQ